MKQLVVLPVFALAGCPLLDVEVEVGETCLHHQDVHVDGLAAGTSTHQSFVFDDLSPIHDLMDLDANLRLVRADLHATSGIADFGFVEGAHLAVASGDPDSTLPTLTVLDCTGDCLADGTTLVVPAAVQTDVVDYVRGDSVVVDVQLDGQVPADDWTMDVDVCMSGHFAYAVEP